MKKTSTILAVLFIAFFLIMGRSQWFSEIMAQAEIGRHPLYSETMDLSKTGKFKWKVARDSWVYNEYRNGEAELSLVFDRNPEIPSEQYDKKTFPLELKVTAYAVTKDGVRINRLVENWYYKTDEPFSPESKMGSSWGRNKISYIIASVLFYSFEETFLEIDVLTPDPVLAKASPRLKLIGEHDYAIYGHLPMFYLIRDGGLALCLILLAVLAWKLLKKET